MKLSELKNFIEHNLKPTEDFKARSKTVFISAFETKFGHQRITTSHTAWIFMLRTLGTGVVAVLTLISASAYADTKNVGLNSALYPLKRVYEKVQLAASKNTTKGEIRAKLTARRFKEAEEAKSLGNAEQSKELIVSMQNEAKETLQVLQALEKSEAQSMPAPALKTQQVEEKTPEFDETPKAFMQTQSVEIAVPAVDTPKRSKEAPQAAAPLESTGSEEIKMNTRQSSQEKELKSTETLTTLTGQAEPASTEDTASDTETIKDKSREYQTETRKRARICTQIEPLLTDEKAVTSLDEQSIHLITDLKKACEE